MFYLRDVEIIAQFEVVSRRISVSQIILVRQDHPLKMLDEIILLKMLDEIILLRRDELDLPVEVELFFPMALFIPDP